MTTAKFAAPGSAGAFADRIAWIDFGAGFELIPGAAPVHVQNALPDGFTVDFNISAVNLGGINDPIDAKIPPVLSGAPFGVTGYTGINGYVALYDQALEGLKDETITISNIVVKNSVGQATTTFDWIAADAEVTGPLETIPVSYETWSVTTDGSPWVQIDNLPPATGTATSPEITGVGTSTVLETGIGGFPSYISGPVYSTTAPKEILANCVTSAQEAFAFGIIVTAREQAITDLFQSVALEQAALSHILNAEGKKLQKLIALSGEDSPTLLRANASVNSMVKAVTRLELILQGKLELFHGCFCPAAADDSANTGGSAAGNTAQASRQEGAESV